MKVKEFKGKYAFLCNFYKVDIPFVYNGVTYNTSEAAFQAAKYNGHNAEIVHKVFAKCTPDESKKLGRAIKLRKDWEEVKDSIMFDVVKTKFDADPELKQRLLDTGDMELIEHLPWVLLFSVFSFPRISDRSWDRRPESGPFPQAADQYRFLRSSQALPPNVI